MKALQTYFRIFSQVGFLGLGITMGVEAQNRLPKSLFVIVDGISSDVVEKLDLTNLKAISRNNGYSKAYVGGKKNSYSQTK